MFFWEEKPLLKKIETYLLKIDENITQFGIFNLFLLNIPYFLFSYADSLKIILYLRLVASLISTSLIFSDLYKTISIKNAAFLCALLLTCNITPLFAMGLNMTTPWILNYFISLIFILFLSNWSFLFVNLFISFSILFCGFYLGFCALNQSDILNLSYGFVLFSILSLFFVREKAKRIAAKKKTEKAIAGVIAHEVRGPLTRISLALNLKEHQRIKEERFMNILNRSSNNALSIVDNLLSGLSEGRMFTLKSINIKQVVLSAIEDFPYRKPSLAPLYVEIPSPIPYIKADALAFSHVIVNLLKNSFDSIERKQSGSIWISVYRKKGGVFLSIKDTGEGIDENLKEIVFHQGHTRTHNGSGFGLYFVKSVLERMKMGIEVESKKGDYTKMIISCGKELSPCE